MKYLLLLTIFLASCSDESNVLSGPFLIKDGITYHQTTTKPIRGELHSFYANGQLKDRTPYNKGLRDGLFEAFYENGQLRERVTYLSGIKNGLQETFAADGKTDPITAASRRNSPRCQNTAFHGGQQRHPLSRWTCQRVSGWFL